jgi:tetratricopeptide (TPR) repeat protein
MSQPSPKAPTSRVGRTRRLNKRAFVALVFSAVLLPCSFLMIRSLQTQRSQPQLLVEAKKHLESGKTDLALSYLNNFILANPQESPRLDEALNLRAKILLETARDDAGIAAAINAYNPILARDAEKPEGQEIRRKLINLHLQTRPAKALPAEILARELIKRGANDAEAHRLLGRALELLGAMGGNSANDQLDQARREFELAEKLEPGDVDTAERLAFLYRDRFSKPNLALEVLDNVLETSKANRDKLAAAHLARSRFFLAVGERNSAISEVQAAIKAVPGNIDARLVLAEMATQSGDIRAAKNHLEAIDPRYKGDLRIKLVSGLIQLNDQKLDEAIASWRSGLLQIRGNDEQLTWRLAQILLQLNRVAEAEPLIEQYRRLVGQEQPTPEYQYLKALAAIRTNRADEAIGILESIRYTIDKSLAAQLHFTLGQAYELKQESVKALEVHRKAAELSSRWSGPWLAIARLQENEHPDEAITTLNQGLEAIPGDPSLLAGLGRLLWRRQLALPLDRRNWSELEKVIEIGKRVAPASAELALLQADYLNATNKSDDALALLQAGVKQNPNSVNIWLALINLFNRRGQLDEALIEVDRATASAGEHAVFRSTKATLTMAKSRPQQARAILVEGLAKVPAEERPALWRTLGDYYLAQNDATNARKAFVEWAKLSPDAPEPRMLLLDLALNSGDEDLIRSEVEAMRSVGGSESIYYRLARVQDLLRERPKSAKISVEEQAELWKEAESKINSIKKDAPKLALGSLLEARLFQKRGNLADAIKAYESALKLGAGQSALRPLVILLTQEKRFDDLDRLKSEIVMPVEMDKLAAELSLKMGDVEHAQQLIDRLVQGDPQSLDIRTWQSKVLNAMGRPVEAERAIRFLLDQRPDEPGPWLQLLMFQVGQGQTQAAADTVEQIRARVKTDLPELLWAMCYRVSGQTSKADEAFHAAIRKSPDDTRVRLAAISFYETAGRLVEAEESLRHLLARDPSMTYAIRKLATLLSTRTNDNAAWQEALKLIGPDGSGADGPEDRLTRAIVYSRGSRPEDRAEAIKILQALVTDAPGSTLAQFELAKLYQREGNVAKAREHARRAASSDDAGPDPILAYAGLLLIDKQVDAAVEQLARLEAIAPESLPTIELRARVLHAQGKTAEAGQLLEKAFETRAKSVEALVTGLGILQILDELKLTEVAERIGGQVADLGPQGACAWAGRLAKIGRLEEAAKLLDSAAKAGDPRNAGRIALQLAASRDSDARWLSQADQLLGMALKGEPASIDLLQAQAYLRHLQSRHQEEIDLYNQVLSRNPSDYLFLNNMAWTLSENMNQPEEGLKKIDEAVAKLGFDPHISDTRGVILTRLGRHDEAFKELQTAAASLPSAAVFYHLARLSKLANRPQDLLKYRDLAKQSGLTAADLQATERAEMASIMKESN